jgi:Na+/citrate or Na+/malate symporter
MMTKIIFWMIAAYGISTILVYGSIFSRPRNWLIHNSSFIGELIQCMLCTSMWVGMFLSIFLGSLSQAYFHFLPLNIIIDGGFTSGAVWAINAIIEWFEENRPPKNRVL